MTAVSTYRGYGSIFRLHLDMPSVLHVLCRSNGAFTAEICHLMGKEPRIYHILTICRKIEISFPARNLVWACANLTKEENYVYNHER